MAIPVSEEGVGFDYELFESLVDIEYDLLPPFFSYEDEFLYLQNTSSVEATNMSRAKHWCFTMNNYTADDLDRLGNLEGQVDYLVYGKEVGESGTPHLQGFVSFKTRVRRNTAVNMVGQAHFTVARKVDNAIEYCKKDGDVFEIGNPPKAPGARTDLEDFKAAVLAGELSMPNLRARFSDVVARYPKFAVDFVQDNMPKKKVTAFPLKDWQQELYQDLIRPPDDRKIIFIVDLAGNTGKSWFCHYYCGLHDNAQVILPGKKADMAYTLECMIRVLFIDAPRSKQGEFIQYDFLEDVKNGYVFSPKYESRVKHLEAVHVVVMMNEMPDMSKLSVDRYDIREI